MTRTFTLVEEDLILSEYQKGLAASKIGKLVPCDAQLVYRFLRGRGFDITKGRYGRASESIQKTLLKRNATLRASGIYNPRKRVFSSDEKALAVKSFVEDKLSAGAVGGLLGCSDALVTRLLRGLGVNTGQDQGDRIRRTVLKGYQAGRQIPTSVGYGTKTPVSTPFQGDVVMRSRLEATRAEYFSARGQPWFYEVQRYTLADGRTYLPDFWVPDCTFDHALSVLGPAPVADCLRSFLSATTHRIEDVKGWWRPDHPSYSKVQAFREQSKDVRFDVVVKVKGAWSCR